MVMVVVMVANFMVAAVVAVVIKINLVRYAW
jgi:hypothetical protein